MEISSTLEYGNIIYYFWEASDISLKTSLLTECQRGRLPRPRQGHRHPHPLHPRRGNMGLQHHLGERVTHGWPTDTRYNVIVHENHPSHYQLSDDITVIHRIITILQGFTMLVNTSITAYSSGNTRVFIRVDVAHQQVKGSSSTGNRQSWRR
jgi:hypothetical protein